MLIPVTGRIMAFVPSKYLIASGGLALAGALYYSMSLVPEMDFRTLAIMRASQTAALALLFVPISTIAYATVPQELNGDATALFTMARNVFGGIGISVSTALVADHAQMRQAEMIHTLAPTDQAYNVLLQQVQHGLMAAGDSVAQAMQAAPGMVFQMLREQAGTLAYIDLFSITGLMSLALVPAALFMSGGKSKTGGEAG
jgi:DHA2 family multidrug resistance protein